MSHNEEKLQPPPPAVAALSGTEAAISGIDRRYKRHVAKKKTTFLKT
jgi:hypothetical protein